MIKYYKCSIATVIAIMISLCVFLPCSNTVSAQEPSNPKSNQVVRNIINYLNECTYSGKTVAGAFDYIGDSDIKASQYYNKIEEEFGFSCGIYSTFYKVDKSNKCFVYEEANERIKEHYAEGAIIMLHCANEWGDDCMTLFPDEDPILFLRNFDATYENRNMDVYNRYFQYRESWSDAIEELKDAGVTVIFRPFVEMNNPNFPATYAPTDEGKEYFKRIWQQNYDYMVNERGLNNIVWNFSPASITSDGEKYYPGNDYVDVIAPTFYAGGSTGDYTAEAQLKYFGYEAFIKYGKPFGLSELGLHGDNENGELGDWTVLLATMNSRMPKLSFFTLWTNISGLFSLDTINADKFINDERFIDLEKVPDYQNGVYSNNGVVALFNQKNYGGSVKLLSEGSYTLSQLKSMGIENDFFKSFKLTEGYSVTFYNYDNCSGSGNRVITDTVNTEFLGINLSEIKSVKVEKTEIVNASLNKPVLCSDPDSVPEYINDGTLEFWETYNSSPDCWVIIDLKDVYSINRWEVQNVGNYGEMSDSNTSNYYLQYSTDGKKWKDADVVFGNTANTTSQTISQINAQYVRLYVERPNSSLFELDKTRCAICEFTVWGAKLSSGIKTDWTLMDLSSTVSTVDKSETLANNSTDIYSEIQSDVSNEASTENSEEKGKNTEVNKNTELDENNDNNLIVVIVIICVALVIGLIVVAFIIKKRKVIK